MICDRFPVSQFTLMDGPNADRIMAGRRHNLLTKFFAKLEKSYYQQIISPEVLFVLRLDPEIAVRRKTNEDSATVRTRNEEVWRVDWRNTSAHVVDAGRPQDEVLSKIKRIVWQEL